MYQPIAITKDRLYIAKRRAEMHLDIINKAITGETYEKIGSLYNLSRQRIHQIIVSLSKNEQETINENIKIK